MTHRTTAGVGIETTFAGTRFRSRLEAKWAAFMTQLEWEWTYEPFDAHGYIPDFAVTGDRPLLIEVKPGMSIGELAAHTPRLDRSLDGLWDHDVLVVGASPFLPATNGWKPTDRTPGLLGERMGGEGEPSWAWEEAAWQSCSECQMVGVTSSVFSYVSRPCGFYDGNIDLRLIDGAYLEAAWANASNVTQWKPTP